MTFQEKITVMPRKLVMMAESQPLLEIDKKTRFLAYISRNTKFLERIRYLNLIELKKIHRFHALYMYIRFLNLCQNGSKRGKFENAWRKRDVARKIQMGIPRVHPSYIGFNA